MVSVKTNLILVLTPLTFYNKIKRVKEYVKSIRLNALGSTCAT